jgi:hypothetical protein
MHKPAQNAYKELLVNSRTGVNISEEELLRMDEFVSPLIKKGQSVRHIFMNNPNELTFGTLVETGVYFLSVNVSKSQWRRQIWPSIKGLYGGIG